MPKRTNRLKRLRRTVGGAVKRAKKRIQKTTKRTAKAAKRKIKKNLGARALKRVGKKATKKTLRAAKRFRKSSIKALKSSGKRLKKLRRNLAKQRKQREAKRRSELRIQKREFGRLVLVGEQLPEEFQKGYPAEDPGSSRPGQPPRMRTGKGRQSITVEIRMNRNKPEGRVYVDKKIAPYMAMWEYRKDGKGRPFLKPAVVDNIAEYGAQAIREIRKVPTGQKQKATVR